MGGKFCPQQDEGLVPQLLQGNAVPPGQRVAFADHQTGTVPDKEGGVKGILRHRQHHASYVQRAGFHIGKADMDVPGAESLVRVNGFADLVVLRDDLGSLFIKLLSL